MNELAKRFYEKTGLDFTDFYTDYKNYYKFVINNYTKDNNIANDLTNDGFVKILNNIELYDSTRSSLTTWCYTIMINSVKYWHRQKKLRIIYDDEAIKNLYIEDEYVDPTELDILYETIYYIIYNELESKPLLKESVILRDINKLSYAEIAERLNLNLSTVKTRVRKGRLLVKDIYYKKYNDL